MYTSLTVLIIEDQEYPLEFMQEVLAKLGASCAIAKWYSQAKEMIESGEKYDLVLLDHRMPMTDPGCTDLSDFNRFTDQLRSIGYSLLDSIRNNMPNAVVIGTSSLSAEEIESGGFVLPDVRMDKTNPWEEIPRVLRELKK